MHSLYRFILAGILNTSFGFLITLLLLSILPFKFYISMALASICGVVFNFFSFQRLAFKSKFSFKIMGNFFSAYLIIYLLNILFMSILINMGFNKFSAFIISFPFVVIITYFLNKQYVFKT